MFNTIRQFALISIILILPITIFLGIFFRGHIEDDIIIQIAEDANISAGEGFSGAVWRRYAKSLSKLPCKQEPCPDTKAFYKALEKDITAYFSRTPLLKYNIYYPSGIKLVTEEQFDADVTLDKQSKLAFVAAQYGSVKSVLLVDYLIGGQTHTVVRTFVPIFTSSGAQSTRKVEGVAELFYDVTNMWESPTFYQIFGIAVFGGVLLMLFGMVFYIAHNAENIIARQHEMTQDLTDAKATAEEENRAKSRFLANVSHELRTPLNAIIGFSEILKDEVMGPLGNEQYKEYVKDIHVSGVHLLSLINDILDFSKADAGKLEVQMTDVDVNKVLSSSMRLVEPRAVEAEVELIQKLPEEHVVLKTDAKRLKQVMLNLLSNSVKFTPQGGSVTIHAWLSAGESRFIIEVKDTGVGISAKDISKVMQTFGQAENKLSRRYEGTGLGLPLSKKLVELMKGTFDIRSKENSGTTVTITLPLVVPSSSAEMAPPAFTETPPTA